MAEGSPNEDVIGPSPDGLETPNIPPLEVLERHDTNFTFTFCLNQALTLQASPSKKCIRVSDDAPSSPSSKRFCLPEDGETPQPQTPCPTSPPQSSW